MGHQADLVRVVALHVENLKRVRVVDITPEGDLVIIAGRNGSGKTTTIDAIAWAIGGARLFGDQPDPVRHGEHKAEVTVDLGELLVTRTWTADGKTKLVVTNAQGVAPKSPQALLDTLIGSLSFDPLQFANMAAKDQRAALLRLVELPFDLDEIDGRRQAVFDRRTTANRDLKRAVTVAAVPRPEVTSGEVPSMAEAVAELAAASELQRRHDEVRRAYDEAEDSLGYAQHQRDAAQEALRLADERVNAAVAKVTDASAAVAALPPDPDVAALAEAVAVAERAKDVERELHAWRSLQGEVTAAQSAVNALTSELEAIDAEKLAGLQGARMPIDGLAIADDGVLFRDVPFTQASGAERLRVSLAIGMAANPKLRVLLIRDASLLDDDSMAVVREMAGENDMQVWAEVVGDGGPTAVHIVDGTVAP